MHNFSSTPETFKSARRRAFTAEKMLRHLTLNHFFQFFSAYPPRPGGEEHDDIAFAEITAAARSPAVSLDDRFAKREDSVSIVAETPEASFHPFSKLPTELRLHIWQFSLPERRGREIGPMSWSRFRACGVPTEHDCPLPRILWVNQESREVAIKINKYTIRDHTLKHLLPGQGRGFEYVVDYELDTFVFRDMLNWLHYTSALLFYGSESSFRPVKAELERIVHLKIDALDPTPDWFSSQVEKYLRLILPVFTSLESVCFALHLEIGEASRAELDLETAQSLGAQYLAEYKARQELQGMSWQPPRLDLRIVEVPY
ncbi:uncharacterized protein PAC_12964 [Phialocephala subalpina]|uniref:2EXR domain-containing protein n=1 Tax=Phialocephala subalpina TaxID=576137 RepID=A0A1L7XDM4_9HELO|nr:uncharacterized protein PAC_12964 [Phialocephala subalpina]